MVSRLGSTEAPATASFSLSFPAAFLGGAFFLMVILGVALAAVLVVALIGVFVVVLSDVLVDFFTTFFRAGSLSTSTTFGLGFLGRSTRSVLRMPLGGALAFGFGLSAFLAGGFRGVFFGSDESFSSDGLDSESFLDSFALASVDLVVAAGFFLPTDFLCSIDFGSSNDFADLDFFGLLIFY